MDTADRIQDSVPVEPGIRDCPASRCPWMVTLGESVLQGVVTFHAAFAARE